MKTGNGWIRLVGLSLVSIGLCSCAAVSGEKGRSFAGSMKGKYVMTHNGITLEKTSFGETLEGKKVDLYRITNRNGMRIDVTNYGCIVVRLLVPDREGNLEDVVLGYDDLAAYIKDTPYFGAVVGRYGNRIAKGRFTLDGVEYKLARNNMGNHLHGGLKGFDKVVWEAEPIKTPDGLGLKLSYLSRDGEEGYPGNLACTVTYLLTNTQEFRVHYRATTDASTPINLTQHSYWNLAGQGSRDILEHELMLNADRFTPVGETLIPTGELRPVAGTPMDFTKPAPIGARINQKDKQLEYGGGYDHNWVLNKRQPGALTLAARVHEPSSGRVMEVFTTEPGIQFYAGNFLDGSHVGKGGKVYEYRYGFCLETQHFPDSPNQTDFPSVTLKPGQHYEHTCIYRFDTR